MSARQQLIDILTPIVPDSWALIPYEDDVDEVATLTLMVRQRGFTKPPAAPVSGKYLTSYILTLIAPGTDFKGAEDDLDDAVATLLIALDGVNKTWWEKADKVIAVNRLAYDITLNLIGEIKE